MSNELICNNCGQVQETTYKENKMNPLKSNLNSCREGDYIYSCSDGWVKVEDLYEKNLETNTNGIYTLDGKGHYTDLYPSAWISNPFNPDDKPPYQFKEGDEVRVWQRDYTKKRKRIFAHMKNNKYFCYDSGQTKWTSENSVTGWNNCVIR